MLNNNSLVKDTEKRIFGKSSELPIPLKKEQEKIIEKLREYCWQSQDAKKAKKYNLTPCVGLAGCQMDFFYKVFCILIKEENDTFLEKIIVNPEVYSYSYQKTYITTGEGCLSVDVSYEGVVPRHQKIKIRGYDYLEKKYFDAEWSGLISIVAQHEFDHLNGMLYYQRSVSSDKIDPEWIPLGDVKNE